VVYVCDKGEGATMGEQYKKQEGTGGFVQKKRRLSLIRKKANNAPLGGGTSGSSKAGETRTKMVRGRGMKFY